MENILKAKGISDAKISFVSLVDKAANKRQFLITKAQEGQATFSTYGKIIKVDNENHYVTGIVYEPMTEDSHENYMTADEIQKAAYWFAKNGDKVDLQHSFEPLEGAAVVENWIAKADFDIDGESVQKGSWLMTVEVSDPDVWGQIEKGEITGFSMGGVGKYSDEDVDLDAVEKSKSPEEKLSLLQKIAKRFGYDMVKKGAVADYYSAEIKRSNFWTAFSALRETLHTEHYDFASGRYVDDFEPDEEKVREALTEFNEIIVNLLKTDGIAKALAGSAPAAITKAGKKMSRSNKEELGRIYEALGKFKAGFDDDEADPEDPEDPDKKNPETEENKEKEEKEVKKSEVEQIVQEAVAKAMEPITKALSGETGEQIVAKGEPEGGADEEVTVEAIQKMVENSIAAAVEPVSKQLEEVMKSRALPSHMDGSTIKKEEPHYMTGIL